MEQFCNIIPKVELHAHLNGSLSSETLLKLMKMKNLTQSDQLINPSLLTYSGGKKTMTECFKLFSLIHQITDSPEAIYRAAYDVIQDFSKDNVRYLELRSTPRNIEGKMTKEQYIESVLTAIKDNAEKNPNISVKVLLSIDRRNSLSEAYETAKLAEKYMHLTDNDVVGVDLSGDPQIPGKNKETEILLSLPPDRIGHGTFLHDSENAKSRTESLKIPIEMCLTSNLISGTVKSYEDHHFKLWFEKNHPCIICTDDKGIFGTSLSREYYITAEKFLLSEDDVWNLSYHSIDYIFADFDMKETLKNSWIKEKDKVFKAIK
ncbi:adenosine deaminase-like protein A [Centruroides sculpturatus]|uniref:adenosine deaminase-like protein A n=1 Tax=Centruroides sculpturatus TaxID=218467 RepID=UPI000C6E90BD|nr:adenosine deaminase-like protein A [Centruroides sculpturatus]